MADAKVKTVAELLGEVKSEEYASTHEFTATTLEEQGPNLLIGQESGGQVLRAFSFRKPDFRVELEIGEIRADPQFRGQPAKLTTAILAKALDSLIDNPAFDDEINKGQKGEQLRRLAVGSLCFADVAYLCLYWAFVRRMFRRDVPIPLQFQRCKCGARNDEGRLRIGEARIAAWDWEAGAPPRAVVHMSDALSVGNLMARKFVVGPPSWSRCLWPLDAKDTDNEAKVDLYLGAGSVVAGDDGDEHGPWGKQRIEQFVDMPTWDMESLAEAARLTGGNIQPIVPFECPECEEDQYLPLSMRDLGVGFI